jgi:hypothetical protein
MMTQEERIGLIPYLFKAYDRACEKNTKFHDGIVVACSPKKAEQELTAYRDYCELHERDGKLSFYDLIREELTEYFVASLKGDEVKAREELLDCFAVLMREWERITEK